MHLLIKKKCRAKTLLVKLLSLLVYASLPCTHCSEDFKSSIKPTKPSCTSQQSLAVGQAQVAAFHSVLRQSQTVPKPCTCVQESKGRMTKLRQSSVCNNKTSYLGTHSFSKDKHLLCESRLSTFHNYTSVGLKRCAQTRWTLSVWCTFCLAISPIFN